MRPRATIAALYGNFSASILVPAAGSSGLRSSATVPSGVDVANGRFFPRPYAAHLAYPALKTPPRRYLFNLVHQRLFAGLDLARGCYQLGTDGLDVAAEYGRFPTSSSAKNKFSR